VAFLTTCSGNSVIATQHLSPVQTNQEIVQCHVENWKMAYKEEEGNTFWVIFGRYICPFQIFQNICFKTFKKFELFFKLFFKLFSNFFFRVFRKIVYFFHIYQILASIFIIFLTIKN
jgi:hypothetical protein